MKKLILGLVLVLLLVSLIGCGKEQVANNPENENSNQETTVVENTVEDTTTPTEPQSGEEQLGVGNTDAGMVVLALEQYFAKYFPDVVKTVNVLDVKVYSEQEIADDETIKSHNLGENDIVFEAHYELEIAEGVEDMNQFTAANGVLDGQWIREKYNCGIIRNGEANGEIDAFGTGF